MDSVDQIAAAKASLELMTQENQELLEKFQGVIEKLAEIEKLEGKEKRSQFRALEQSGAFMLNGVDIRHFAHSQSGPLSPPKFMRRTQRRLQNTITLLDKLIDKNPFEEGTELRQQIEAQAGEVIDVTDQQAVIEFKTKVEHLRESALFSRYQEAKTTFIRKDPDLKAEAEIIAAKETTEDGEELCRSRQEEIERIGQAMEKGEISTDAAQAALEKLGSPDAQESKPQGS